MNNGVSELRSTPLSEAVLRGIGQDVPRVFADMECRPELRTGVNDFESLLFNLQASAYAPILGASHRTAACNALCAVVEYCRTAENEDTRKRIFYKDVYHALLRIYVDRFDAAKGKAMKQIFHTLEMLMQDTDRPSEAAHLKREVLLEFIRLLESKIDHVRAKPALIGLTSLISHAVVRTKDVLSIFLHVHGQPEYNLSSEGRTKIVTHDWLRVIFEWTEFSNVAHATCQLATVWLKHHREDMSLNVDFESYPVWAEPLLQTVEKFPKTCQAFQAYLLPDLFKVSVRQFWLFINSTLNKARQETVQESGKGGLFDTICTTATSESTQSVLLASMQIGKELGLIQDIETTSCQIEVLEDVIKIPVSRIHHEFLLQNHSPVRLVGLSLLINAKSQTKPLSGTALRCLKLHLPDLLSHGDPYVRGVSLGLMKYLLDRIRGATFALQRHYRKSVASENQVLRESSRQFSESLQEHETFVIGILRMSKNLLSSSRSYQARFSGLKCLTIIAKAGLDPRIRDQYLAKQANGQTTWPFRLDLKSPDLERLLLDLLADPYDDVRLQAFNFLEMILDFSANEPDKISTDNGFHSPKPPKSRRCGYVHRSEMNRALKIAEAMMLKSGRMDVADGFGRLCSLLARGKGAKSPTNTSTSAFVSQDALYEMLDFLIDSVEDCVGLAERNLADAVDHRPVHGYLIALRYIIVDHSHSFNALFSQYTQSGVIEVSLRRLQRALRRIWECVRPILCDDAPEGFLIDSLDFEISFSTKDLLSYAWRAVKDSSLLLREIALNERILEAISATNNQKSILEEIGELCFEQLSDLRHRGAFSTVAQSFSTVCGQCAASKHAYERSLISKWFERILHLMIEKASQTTRRSAGLPALGLAVMKSKVEDFVFIKSCIHKFQQIASVKATDVLMNSGGIPQVHALNTLKACFSDPKLVIATEQFLVQTLDVASQSLQSSFWAIRNCGLMLFSSLLNRLTGADISKDGDNGLKTVTRLDYDKYPGLLNLLLAQVESSSQGNASDPWIATNVETVFPILYLIQKAPPPKFVREELSSALRIFERHPHRHIRNIAARTWASLYYEEPLLQIIDILFKGIPDFSVNCLDGRILCARYLLKSYTSRDTFSITEALEALKIIKDSITTPISALSLMTFIDMINVVAIKLLSDTRSDKTDVHVEAKQLLAFRHNRALQALLSLPEPAGRRLLHRTLQLNGFLNITLQSTFLNNDIGQNSLQHQTSEILKMNDLESLSRSLEIFLPHLMSASHELKIIFLRSCLDLLSTRECRNDVIMALKSFCAQILCKDPLLVSPQSPRSLLERLSQLKSYDSVDSMSIKTFGDTLILHGFVLVAKIIMQGSCTAFIHDIRSWISLIASSLDEYNDLPMRLAAVRAFSCVYAILNLGNAGLEHFKLDLLFAAYEGLNDDDDEVRNMAAATLSSLLLSRGKRLVTIVQPYPPPIVRRIVCSHLVKYHHESAQVAREAICRVTGCGTSLSNIQPVESQLETFLSERGVLFSREKQNLYVDRASESRIWSEVLKHLPHHLHSRTDLVLFVNWTINGLKSLREYASKNYDGPFGWTSRADLFVLGWRVICASGILLAWQFRSRIDAIDGTAIRVHLLEFYDVGQQNDLHETWLQLIKHILDDSITQNVSRVVQVLSWVSSSAMKR